MGKNSKNAVIYCRVSTAAQTKRGDGLASQKTRCLEYARMKGYTVVETFTDDLSGKLIERPSMKSMLAYLKKRQADPHVILIDDISWLARGVKPLSCAAAMLMTADIRKRRRRQSISQDMSRFCWNTSTYTARA